MKGDNRNYVTAVCKFDGKVIDFVSKLTIIVLRY